ncbi:chemotaxis protein CheV [Helicobacter enhydrae]|uniref:Chemotaxis protein CheV n=1 Tax=Helicobacter enhydrae TaxID=222136 RepID=A0A1B1U588_9HELI|nr:chemotaxis protein [Helicobacter enhydrae]ANV97918.1 chemotaxis protein CheV [Helicobacter enhydrae]
MNLSNIVQVTNLHKNNELQLLCFFLEQAGDIYAINVFKIREIVKYTGDITKITYEKNSLIEGLITIRDMTIPLIDMKKWFYYNSNEPEKNLDHYAITENRNEEIIMICEFSRWTIGVRIYQADRILNKKWEEIEQGIGFNSDAGNGKLVSKTQYFDGRLVQVVDIEKMLIDVFPWIELDKAKELDSLDNLKVSKTILLADDSPVVLKTMQTILNKLGIRHRDFYNGKTLLNYLFDERTNIDDIGLIITDLEMPETSGFEVIKQVKNNPNTAHIPVVVNSSMSGSSNEDMAMSLDANGFISKSNPKEIQEIIKQFLCNQEF